MVVYIGRNSNSEQRFHIPLKFWKIVYYLDDSKLHRIGFVLSHEDAVKDLDFVFAPNERITMHSSTKDPFTHLDDDLVPYIVDVRAIEFSTGLNFTPAAEKLDADRFERTYLFNQDNQANSIKFSKDILTNYV